MVLSAGLASLDSRRVREMNLWREAVAELDSLEMHGLAAAARWRLAELDVDDAAVLRAKARAWFDGELIDDIQRYVDLLAPAKR
jgi:hypothetical protein